MSVAIVNPRLHRRGGNRVTALRWAQMLRRLGCRVRVVDPGTRVDADLCVALNARLSADAVERFAAQHPDRPVVVVVTGTDVYDADPSRARVAAVLRRATSIVVLQPLAAERVPADCRSKVRLVPQSVAVHGCARSPDPVWFDALVLASVRGVKDPLLAARAAARLPGESRVRVVLAGDVLEPELEPQLAELSAREPRFTYLGELAHRAALLRLCSAGVLVSSSRHEGGPVVLSEAAALGVPILATRIEGHTGLLGDDFPGLFDVGDEPGLAALLERTERDADFRRRLVAAAERLAELARPQRELSALARLLGDLGLRVARPAP